MPNHSKISRKFVIVGQRNVTDLRLPYSENYRKANFFVSNKEAVPPRGVLKDDIFTVKEKSLAQIQIMTNLRWLKLELGRHPVRP